MTKQRPDGGRVANELMGASAFFRKSPPEPPAIVAPPPVASLPAQSIASVQDNVQTVLPVRPVRRQMIRHPFELYMDQLDRLRNLATLQRQRGESGSMSKMVRDALDRLLDEHGA